MTYYVVFKTDLDGNIIEPLTIPEKDYTRSLQQLNIFKRIHSLGTLEIRELTLKTENNESN